MKSTLNPNATAWTPATKEAAPAPEPELPPGELPFIVVLIGPPGVGKTTQGTPAACGAHQRRGRECLREPVSCGV